MQGSAPKLPKKKILVVDDSVDIRRVLTDLLQSENYAAYTANNGVEALKLIEQTLPDLILSDINMPGMDGIELFKTIRKNPRFRDIPFVFLTSRDSADEVKNGIAMGANDYLTKPIDPDDLFRAIDTQLLLAADINFIRIGQEYLETMAILAKTIEGRDKHTSGHLDRVTEYAQWMAEALRWSAEKLRELKIGVLLHDIGKIIVPETVLNKTEALTSSEWGLIKQHPTVGANILREADHLRNMLPYVLYHHERWDGSGYPEGLKGRQIPLGARILAIADVYDALTSHRPYHPPRPLNEVIQFMKWETEKHFDPNILPLFIQILEQHNE
jgi:putative two-component system response regulator